jgi:hypothetical protein
LNNGRNWNIPLEEFRYEFEVVLASQRRAKSDVANIYICANETTTEDEKNKRRRRLLLFIHARIQRIRREREKRWEEDSCDESKT